MPSGPYQKYLLNLYERETYRPCELYLGMGIYLRILPYLLSYSQLLQLVYRGKPNAHFL
jgi:hypothetical protein